MKTTKRVMLGLLMVLGLAQCKVPTYNGQIKEEKIIKIEQLKEDLWVKTNQWFVETFNNAESVIQFQDKEAGKMVGKYVYSYGVISGYTSQYNIKSIISIDVRDAEVRIQIYDPYYSKTYASGYSTRTTQYIPANGIKMVDEKIKPEWKKLITDLENRLNEDDTW